MAVPKVPKARNDIQLLIGELRDVKAVVASRNCRLCATCKDAIPKVENVLKINNDETLFKS